jgi:hypothetical protein
MWIHTFHTNQITHERLLLYAPEAGTKPSSGPAPPTLFLVIFHIGE